MQFTEAIKKFVAWQSFSSRKSTKDTYRIHTMGFGLFMRNCNIEDVTLKDIMDYLTNMRELEYDENIMVVRCTIFRKFFTYYQKQGIVKFDPSLIPMMERSYVMPKVANIEDYNKVLAVTVSKRKDARYIRNRAIVMFYKDTGMRVGEGVSVDIPDLKEETIEVKEGDKIKLVTLYYAVIKTEKTKKLHPIRKVFWTKETNDAIKAWLKIRASMARENPRLKSDALFVSLANVQSGQRLSVFGVCVIMKHLSQKAGLSYTLTIHMLRHMFGHDMAKNKFPSSTISTMLGHATPVSSYVYTMLQEQEMGIVYNEMRGKPQ